MILFLKNLPHSLYSAGRQSIKSLSAFIPSNIKISDLSSSSSAMKPVSCLMWQGPKNSWQEAQILLSSVEVHRKKRNCLTYNRFVVVNHMYALAKVLFKKMTINITKRLNLFWILCISKFIHITERLLHHCILLHIEIYIIGSLLHHCIIVVVGYK